MVTASNLFPLVPIVVCVVSRAGRTDNGRIVDTERWTLSEKLKKLNDCNVRNIVEYRRVARRLQVIRYE